MKYEFVDPEAMQAASGPTQQDLLIQLEYDHLAASQAGDKEQMKALDARYAKVKAAKSDAAARKAYDTAAADAAAQTTEDKS